MQAKGLRRKVATGQIHTRDLGSPRLLQTALSKAFIRPHLLAVRLSTQHPHGERPCTQPSYALTSLLSGCPRSTLSVSPRALSLERV